MSDSKSENARWDFFILYTKRIFFFSREEGATYDCGDQLHILLWSRFGLLLSGLGHMVAKQIAAERAEIDARYDRLTSGFQLLAAMGVNLQDY